MEKLEMEHKARLRELDEAIKQKREHEEALKKAELDAVRARENAWNKINRDIEQSRLEAQQRQAQYEWENNCRNARSVSIGDDCFNYLKNSGYIR